MVRGKKDLELAKAGYKDAEDRGDRDEQARWANQVGHACKERGQYVEALKWFRKDYEISTRRMKVDASPPGNLMPTCQSMGEIYLRLQDFEQALIYQRKHFQLAEKTDNLIEQQRASTQLGRTYLEIYEQEDDFSALRNAKEYLKISMDLARTIKENPPSRDSPSFVKELVDSYNNMGLLMMIIEDPRQAIDLFHQGLTICNEEELREDDDARSRIHHNLGRLYCEQRQWEKAKQHTQTDITICQRIPHPQGEAKGFINLGEIHFKCQKYEEAARCFERALQVARSLEDEDSLVSTAQKNLEVVHQAQEQMGKLIAGEQQLRKLQRKKMNETSIRTGHHSEEYKLLNELIGIAEALQAWEKHLELAKGLKALVREMGDMEKLGDVFETVGESYYNLRKYTKAKKWHMKSWDLCKRIGHLEGQCVAKINYGNTLDCTGEWEEARKAYEDAYEIARSQGKTRMLLQQISALENMHYCYFVRLEQMADAKTIQSKIKCLKDLRDMQGTSSGEDEHCSETDNEADLFLTASKSNAEVDCSKKQHPSTTTYNMEIESSDDDAPLASVLPQRLLGIYEAKKTGKKVHGQKASHSTISVQKKDIGNQDCSQSKSTRKRTRIVLSDDEGMEDSFEVMDIGLNTQRMQAEEGISSYLPGEDLKALISSKTRNENVEDTRHQLFEPLDSDLPYCIEIAPHVPSGQNNNAATGGADEAQSPNKTQTFTAAKDCFHHNLSSEVAGTQSKHLCNDLVSEEVHSEGLPPADTRCTLHDLGCANCEPYQSTDLSPQQHITASPGNGTLVQSVNLKVPEQVAVRIAGQTINVDLIKKDDDRLIFKNVDWLKEEIVRVYICSNPAGLKPLLRHLVLKGRILQPSEKIDSALNDLHPLDSLEAIVDCWALIPLVERYPLFCELHHQSINRNVLSRLRNSKDLEDKVSVSGCNLDDYSALPLLMAINGNASFSHLDFSHNLLGNQSMQKVQQMIATSNQRNLGLVLDLHNNQLGAASLGHICECPITLSRLEVLNLSGNRLTDTAARYLTALIKHAQALEVLKLEDCHITSRTVLKISSALQADSPLVKFSIGKNNPISSLAIVGLLEKLSSLNSFSELDLTGVCLDKPGVEAVGFLLRSSRSISVLMLGETGIQNEGVLELSSAITQHPRMIVRLDLSFCGFSVDIVEKLCTQIHLLRSLVYLNLSGNKLGEKGAVQVASVLSGSECRLKTLLLERSHLGWMGILIILKALHGNSVLQQLILGGNTRDNMELTSTKTSLPANDQSTSLEQKLESVAPKVPVCCTGTASLETLQDHFSDQKENGKFRILDTNMENPCHAPDACLTNCLQSRDDEVDAISSSEFGLKVCKLSVIADSEDDGEAEQSSNKPLDEDRVSSSKYLERTTSAAKVHGDANVAKFLVNLDCNKERPIDDIAAALTVIEGLHFLDLTDNGLNSTSVEKLYLAWLAPTRSVNQPRKHIVGKLVHFTADNMECCSSNPCCEIS